MNEVQAKLTYLVLPSLTQISDLLQGQPLTPRSGIPASSSRGSGSPKWGISALEEGFGILNIKSLFSALDMAFSLFERRKEISIGSSSGVL